MQSEPDASVSSSLAHVPKVVTDISEQLYLPRLTVQLRPGAPTRHPYLIPSPSVPMLTTSDVLPTGNAQV
jgi:hypothetical protein